MSEKRYEFRIVVREVDNDLWENLNDANSSRDEIAVELQGMIDSALFDSGFTPGYDTEITFVDRGLKEVER